MSNPTDPVALTADLIKCQSVTPEEGGALLLLEGILSEAGFACTRVDRNGIANLFARWGSGNNGRTIGFNGHTDVVPIGDIDAWSVDPFGAEIKDGLLYGRGATDMKSGVAAFAAAAIDFIQETPPDGSIVMAITGDEEGVATDGTVALLNWMNERGEKIDHCLVGEPTCPNKMGEMLKIGRRGSMTAYFTASGVQGHSAYPHRARNPVPVMARLVDPSTLAVTTFDTGNPANNVIPAACQVTANIRFNDAHSSASLAEWVSKEAKSISSDSGVEIDINFQVSGESFLTEPGEISEIVANAVIAETGISPKFSTSGGTSDARFIKNHCPVVEFGLVGKTMHQVDECVPVEQIVQLKSIYSHVLRGYFGI